MKVVEVGNMTRAAEALHVAQPSLGVQIKALELEIGVELLERHSRGVSPTAAGRVMFERATSILQRVDALRAEVSGAAIARTRSLAMGFPPSVMRLLGPEVLTDAETYAREVTLEIVEERSFVLLDALSRNEVDLALCYNTNKDAKLIRTPLLEEELVVVAAPSYFDADGPVSLTKLLKGPLAISGERGLIHGLIQSEALRLSEAFKPNVSIHSVEMLKSIIKQGRLGTILPYGLAAEEIASGTLAFRRIKDRPLYRTLYLVRMRGNRNAEGAYLEPFLARITDRLQAKLGDLARATT